MVYAVYELALEGGMRRVTARELVYRAFRGAVPEGMYVVPVNGDLSDARPENLILSSRYMKAMPSRRRAVEALDRRGNVVGRYDTCVDAGRAYAISAESVSYRARGACRRDPFDLCGVSFRFAGGGREGS